MPHPDAPPPNRDAPTTGGAGHRHGFPSIVSIIAFLVAVTGVAGGCEEAPSWLTPVAVLPGTGRPRQAAAALADPALSSPRPWTRFLARVLPERTDRWRSLDPPDIRDPGPDTADFPNSPFTLPRGGIYIETNPVYYEGAVRGASPPSYTWEYLLRLGLTDHFELRLYGNGLTVLIPPAGAPPGSTQVGFSPVVFDSKIHLWDEVDDGWMPATGLEVYVQSDFASEFLQQGVQPGVMMLFEKSLPADLTFEFNAGVVSQTTRADALVYTAAVQWSLGRAIFTDTEVFLHGFQGQAALPRGLSESAIGGGFLRFFGSRWSLFGSWNTGLQSRGPATILYVGMAGAL